MKRRDFSLRLATASMALTAAPALRAQGGPVEGTHYVKLNTPAPVTLPEGKKIEVVEFFWYECPHCNAFELPLEAWVKKLPADVAFRRVHVAFRPSFEPLQRLYATLENMNLVEALHRKVFYAVHQQGARLDKPEAVIDFVVANGVDRTKFTEMYNSFGVQSKVRQGKQLSEAYKIDGVPALGIHGRFYTSPALAGGEGASEIQGQTRALALTDQLVASLRKG